MRTEFDTSARPASLLSHVVAAGTLILLLVMAGCNSASSRAPTPPSTPGGLPGSSPSLPGSSPSSPSSRPSSQPSSSGGKSGKSGQSGSPPSGSQDGTQSGGASMPGSSSGDTGQSGGTQSGGAGGTGSGLPDGQSGQGGSGGQLPAGGQAGTGSEPGGGDESWEDGLPGSGDDGWQTSNQVPGGGESRIPPMPSERGKPPGSGDGELDGALEDFDGEILSEREVIRKRSNETAGSGGGGLPEASAGEPAAGGGTADVAATRGGPMGVPSNRNAPPAPSPVATAGVPDDIPDARDDDIIARQLREAAMAESDPALKEKLWDEYRRYKGI